MSFEIREAPTGFKEVALFAAGHDITEHISHRVIDTVDPLIDEHFAVIAAPAVGGFRTTYVAILFN